MLAADKVYVGHGSRSFQHLFEVAMSKEQAIPLDICHVSHKLFNIYLQGDTETDSMRE